MEGLLRKKFLKVFICSLVVIFVGLKAEQVSIGMETDEEVNCESVSYEILKTDSIDKNRVYKGSYYAIRVFNVPKIADRDERILMMSTKKTNERLLLVFPKDKLKYMRSCASRNAKVDILFRSNGIFNKNYPLIKLEKIEM